MNTRLNQHVKYTISDKKDELFKNDINKVFLLKSGRLLSEHYPSNALVQFKIWDLDKKSCLSTIYKYRSLYGARVEDYLPEGELLSEINDEIILSPEKEFECQIEIQLPEEYDRIKDYSGYSIFKMDNNHFMLAGKNETNCCLELYELTKNHQIIKIGSIATKYKATDKLCMLSSNVFCVTTHKMIEFWRKEKDHINLIWCCEFSTRNQHHLFQTAYWSNLFANYRIDLLGRISDDEVLCQAKCSLINSSEYPDLLFKVNLKERRIKNIITTDHHSNGFLADASPWIRIGSSNTFFIELHGEQSKIIVLDTDTMDILYSFYPTPWYGLIGLTKDDDLIVHNSTQVAVLEFPVLKDYLKLLNAVKHEKITKEIAPFIYQEYIPLVNLIGDYIENDIQCSVSNEELKLSQSPMSFYKKNLTKHLDTANLRATTSHIIWDKTMKIVHSH